MIKLFHGGRQAPGCYIIARQLADGSYDTQSETDSVLVQADWDFPGLAGTFGGRLGHGSKLKCTHDGTDGTVTCPGCGKGASWFIGHAIDYLDENDGATAEDPGYFATVEP